MTKDEALKMAIDVLQNYAQADSPVWRKALNACKEALEQPQPRLFLDLSNSNGNHPVEQPAQEPFMFTVNAMQKIIDDWTKYDFIDYVQITVDVNIALAKAQEASKEAKQEFIGLTDDEILQMKDDWGIDIDHWNDFACAIEQALKEKNT